MFPSLECRVTRKTLWFPHHTRSQYGAAGRGPSGAKARTEKKRLIAALKRCATQNLSFSATTEGRALPETIYEMAMASSSDPCPETQRDL